MVITWALWSRVDSCLDLLSTVWVDNSTQSQIEKVLWLTFQFFQGTKKNSKIEKTSEKSEKIAVFARFI